MSTLSRTLHDAVDPGDAGAAFDVTTLSGRVRRRRAVRAGVRGAVGVGAAGAVAVGGVHVAGTGEGPVTVVPGTPGERSEGRRD